MDKILNFIKYNKLLIFILVTMLILIAVVALFPVKNSVQETATTSKNTYYTTKDFTVINENGKITIQVLNKLITDPVLIKNTLGIPQDYPVNIEIPGPLLHDKYSPQTTPVTIPDPSNMIQDATNNKIVIGE